MKKEQEEDQFDIICPSFKKQNAAGIILSISCSHSAIGNSLGIRYLERLKMCPNPQISYAHILVERVEMEISPRVWL